MITEAQLNAFLVNAQAKVDAFYAVEHPTLVGKNRLGIMKGKKYARIISSDGVGRYAFGFVDLETGNLLKAAGWKAPALNFPRGTIENLKGVGMYGIG